MSLTLPSISIEEIRSPLRKRTKRLRGLLLGALALFLCSYVALFLDMHRVPTLYDEGMVLTGAMRVAAGQVPHRDFYTVYGPADFYIPAWLFRIFGQSMLVSRLLNLLVEALTTAVVFVIASRYCARWIAFSASLLTLLWLDGLSAFMFSTVMPVALLSVASCALLFALVAHPLPKWRLFAAGLLTGLSVLYRYDTGFATVAIQMCFLTVAAYTRPAFHRRRHTTGLTDTAAYLAGVFCFTLPVLAFFVKTSTLSALFFQVVLLQAKHYREGRSLPFPGFHLKTFDLLAVYLPVILVGLSLCLLLYRKRERAAQAKTTAAWTDETLPGAILLLCLLTAAMFLKGCIRVDTSQMFPAFVASILLVAILMQQRSALPRAASALLRCVVCMFILTALFSALKVQRHIYQEGSVAGRLVRDVVGSNAAARDPDGAWCEQKNPLTRGFCFTMDLPRRQTMQFLVSHTRPGQTLYVGLRRHDRVFINDNVSYFATQRLPATAWSSLDPGVQNSSDIQRVMVGELDRSAPPYVVLDSEFESIHEPNGSAKSTGVDLLDNYLHTRYHPVQTFGELAIWQRTALHEL